MTVLKHLYVGTLAGLASWRFVRRGSLSWMTVYLILGCALFSLVSWQLHVHQDDIKQVILDYLLPQTWQGVSEDIIAFFYEKQAKVVIANAILGASLVMASICLFAVKEAFSAKFEQEAGYKNGEKEEFPLLLFS